ncbi:MAG: hypothetical protein MJ165_02905 [Alphaproteobacteria bacterium]|nr:hypothetical protein [Alphaproteobacteria bacterium]
MHDVKKFFVCAFLVLVIFTQTCFAAGDCNDKVEFSAIFKWSYGEVDIITSDIDRKIADDTEVYNAAKARINVLAGMFTKPLQQRRKFSACNESKTCEAGQTLQECSPTLARCFAEAIAQDEYIANLQNRLCNSGINLNKQHDSLRELITSYTPLRLSAPTGGGSTPAPASPPTARSNTSRDDLANDNQMINDQINKSAGRRNMSRDSGGVSGRGIGAIITEINTASKNIRIGTAAFSYPESMVSTGGMQLQTAIANWITRCMEYPRTHDSSAIKKTKPEKTTENGTIRHTCIIESCHEFYTQSSDGLTCERAQSQPIERMQNRPAAMIPSLGDERGDFIKNQTREVQLGRKLSFTAEDKTKYSNDLQSWRAACVSYATTNISTDIAKTYIKETSDKKQTKFEWTCLIEKCQDQQNLSGKVKKMEPTPDGRGCMETNGKSCIPSDKHAEFGQFNEEKNICEVRTCKEDYTLTPDGKCEKTKKLERQAARATTKLEKDFVSDITKLSEAFESVVKRLTKECEKSGGTINDGVCKNAQTTDQQSKAPNNRRGSGKRR